MKRIILCLLTLAIIFALLPQFTMQVMAADKSVDLALLSGDLTINATYLTTNSIGSNDQIVLTGSTTTRRVIVQTSCNIRLSDASITSSSNSPLELSGSGITLNLMLLGTNTLASGQTNNHGYPGIYVNTGTTLNVDGSGSLTVTAGTGTSDSSAGIGSKAYQSSGGTIHISGGTITATGGGGTNGGAGIGSGNNAVIGTLTIDGTANINATGGTNSAGIGEGYYGYGGVININCGTVIATGNGGAGIGGGSSSRPIQNGALEINIGGGIVTASSINGGSGIGSGANWGKASWIHISGGTINATGSVNGSNGGAGIGGGYATTLTTPSDANGRIIIDGNAVVTATGAAGSYLGGAGIGCSYQSHSNMPITIGGNANVTAYAGGNTSTSNKAAAIGGVGSSPVTVSIETSATVKAIANYYAISNSSGTASVMQVTFSSYKNASINTDFIGAGVTKTLTAPFQYTTVAMTVPTGDYIVRNNSVLQIYSNNDSNKVFSVKGSGLTSFTSVKDVTTPSTMFQLNFAGTIAANTPISVCDAGGNVVATKAPNYAFTSLVFTGLGTGPYLIKNGSDILKDGSDSTSFTLTSNTINTFNGVTWPGNIANLNSASVKGVSVSSVGTCSNTIDAVTVGAVSLSMAQAVSNSESLFGNTPGSSLKVAKYASGSAPDETAFESAAVYTDTDTINNGDFFIIRVKSADTSVTNYYKIVVAILSNDGTISTVTIKGVSATIGTSASAISSISNAGSVILTETQASGIGMNTFTSANVNATVKVVKYAAGGSTLNFSSDTAYAAQAITNGDFFIIKVTAQDATTINYYKIVATILSNDGTISTVTIKGVSATIGTSASAISSISNAGSVILTETQASGIGMNTFTTTNVNATVKVVKYAAGESTLNFSSDATYAAQTITNGDFFIIKVTAQDTTTISFYRINVTMLSNDANLTSILSQTITAGSEAGNSSAPKTASISVVNTIASVAVSDIVKHNSGAIVTLYGTDSSFMTQAIEDVILTAGTGTDIYIKVVAADSTTLYYMVTINRAAPPAEITSVSQPSNGIYKTGDNLVYIVTFNKMVLVSGTPSLNLTIGSSTKTALYGSSSGAEVTFIYTMSSGDTDANGITLESDISLNGGKINDLTGNPATLTFAGSTAAGVRADTAAPTIMINTITVNDITSSSAKLTWSAASDKVTSGNELVYKVVYSTTNNLSTVSDAEKNGLLAQDWNANIALLTVDWLNSSTSYFFNVIVKDEAGYKELYSSIEVQTLTAVDDKNVMAVEVNGQKQDAGERRTETVGGQVVTTITVDDLKLETILNNNDNNTIVTLPSGTSTGIVKGELNGQTVKKMEQKDAVLELKTDSVMYTLPAAEINIDAVSELIGSQVALKDIKIDVTIAQSDADTAMIVENAASKNSYQVVVQPVDFSITCTSGGKTIEVSKFNGYVERTVAIPDGIDPSKITTGVVLNRDGTFSHVPTTIVVIDGKYYAKINSLTNSTYSVIYNPVAFSDVTGHWAKDAINDMGSRLIVSGVGNKSFDPNREITRAEFAAIIVRALGLKPGAGVTSFSDIKDTDWFSGYIKTAADYELIKGYSDGTVKPLAMITREEAMAIYARAMKLTSLKTEFSAEDLDTVLNNYKDIEAIGVWAKASVGACVFNQLVNGKAGQTLAPKDNITRAEVAAITQRLLETSGLI